MMARRSPGGARAIEAAPTAVTLFIGETERGPVGPTAISSAVQYQRLFGGYFRYVDRSKVVTVVRLNLSLRH